MRSAIKHFGKIFLNLFLAGIVLAIVIFGIPKFLAFFMPFIIGWVISRMSNPLVVFLEEKMKINRKAVTVFVMAAVVVLVSTVFYLAISILVQQLIGFVGSLPDIWKAIELDISNLGKSMNVIYKGLPSNVREGLASFSDSVDVYINKVVSGMRKPTMTAVGNFAKNLPSAIIGIIMCLLSAYFFIAEKDYLNNLLRKYTPKSMQEKWHIVYNTIISSLGNYIKAQLKIEIWMYLILVVGLAFFDVRYVLLVAFGIALLDLFPIFGTGTVLIPWAVIKLIGADYRMAIGLVALWGGGQLLRQIIQPKIVGDSLGLSPIPTLFLLFVGWKLGGVAGMIIAVPIGIIVRNLDRAGAFDLQKESVSILTKDIRAFRKYTDADRRYHKKYEEDDDSCR